MNHAISYSIRESGQLRLEMNSPDRCPRWRHIWPKLNRAKPQHSKNNLDLDNVFLDES